MSNPLPVFLCITPFVRLRECVTFAFNSEQRPPKNQVIDACLNKSHDTGQRLALSRPRPHKILGFTNSKWSKSRKENKHEIVVSVPSVRCVAEYDGDRMVECARRTKSQEHNNRGKSQKRDKRPAQVDAVARFGLLPQRVMSFRRCVSSASPSELFVASFSVVS